MVQIIYLNLRARLEGLKRNIEKFSLFLLSCSLTILQLIFVEEVAGFNVGILIVKPRGFNLSHYLEL